MLGTNGVVLMNVRNYPHEQLNLGWHTSNDKNFEVDFVGHSWFVRREYLNWMIEKPYKNKFKYSGEDMCLSYACLEHGVKTYVPAHPKNILSLWGSIPEYGMKYGGASSITGNTRSDGLPEMTIAALEMHNDGWKLLIERDREKVTEMLNIFAKPKQNMFFDNIKVAFKFWGKKSPSFIGDSKYASAVKNLFALMDIDYIDVVTRNNVLNFKPYAFNIFFTDTYPQIKNFLESAGFKENEHFIDGRYFLMLM